MSGRQSIDWRASEMIRELRGYRGWSLRDLQHQIEALHRRNPAIRPVSERTLYRIETHGKVPITSVQFAIAQTLHPALFPPHIWGRQAMPAEVLPSFQMAA